MASTSSTTPPTWSLPPLNGSSNVVAKDINKSRYDHLMEIDDMIVHESPRKETFLRVPTDQNYTSEFCDAFSDEDNDFLDEVSSLSFQKLCSLMSTSNGSFSSLESTTLHQVGEDGEDGFSSCWDSSDTSGDETEESYEDCVNTEDRSATAMFDKWTSHSSRLGPHSQHSSSSRIQRRHLFAQRKHRRMSAFPEDVLKAFRPLDEFCLTPGEKQRLYKSEREHNRHFRGRDLALSSSSSSSSLRALASRSSSKSNLLARRCDETFTVEIWNAWNKCGRK